MSRQTPRPEELELPEFLMPYEASPPAPAPPPATAELDLHQSGLWIFILGDMTLFGAFFAGFALQARGQADVFARSAETLLLGVGAFNTLILLTSSLFVVVATRAVAADDRPAAARALLATLLCALLFAGLKLTEYGVELSAGYTPNTNLFFTYYFVLTGIHLMHVVVGMALLLVAWRGLRREAGGVSVSFVEGAGIYWHMVDLLWVVLFPLLYIAWLP